MPDRILIIGEIKDEVQAFVEALAQEFTLSLAATVPEARNRLQKEAFSLIIFDAREEVAAMIATLRHCSSFLLSPRSSSPLSARMPG